MLRICVSSACLHRLDTMALTEQQQQALNILREQLSSNENKNKQGGQKGTDEGKATADMGGQRENKWGKT